MHQDESKIVRPHSEQRVRLDILRQWFELLTATREDAVAIECFCLAPKTKQDEQMSDWNLQNTTVTRVARFASKAHQQLELLFSLGVVTIIDKNMAGIPAFLPVPGKPRLTRWLGVCETFVDSSGRHSKPISLGYVIDMVCPPANLLELTEIYVAYRHQCLCTCSAFDLDPSRCLWDEAMNDAQKRSDVVVQPDKRLSVLLAACPLLSSDLCRLIEQYQIVSFDLM